MSKIILLSLILISGFLFYNYSQEDSNSTIQTITTADETQKNNSSVKVDPKNSSIPQTPGKQKASTKLKQLKPEAQALYSKARDAALSKNYEQAAEALHDSFQKEETLIDRALLDQAFRDFRTHDHFRKLLKMHGRSVYQDLGDPPILLPE